MVRQRKYSKLIWKGTVEMTCTNDDLKIIKIITITTKIPSG